ncbi:MAG: hypothetical protein IJT07_03645 [Oscillospiraceae bacterium]|nr:hypothetical protein [Oscillospiraceae bacterium]
MELREFLLANHLTAEQYDLATEIGAFRGDMLCGLAGENATMPMIPTFLSPDADLSGEETLIVLDAGGTNLRTGVAQLHDGVIDGVEYTKCRMPGIERTVTNDEFYDAIAEKLAPYLDLGDKIGFCFSFPAECLDNGDARLVRFAKEIKVDGAEGKLVCQELLAAIRRRGVTKEFTCVQLNDTAAAMLGGMATVDREKYSGFIGFILGTGINSCYVEKTENVVKYVNAPVGAPVGAHSMRPSDTAQGRNSGRQVAAPTGRTTDLGVGAAISRPSDTVQGQRAIDNRPYDKALAYTKPSMIINMESGMYGGFARGPLDLRLDQASQLPGDHCAEKMLSGVYLGKLIYAALGEAKTAGLLSSAPQNDGGEVPMPDVNAFLADEPSMLDTLSLTDRETVRAMILSVYARAARLCAIILGATALQMHAGREKPICVVLEGSTYHLSPELKKFVARELDGLQKLYGLQFEIVKLEHQSLTGAAYAALG